MADFDPTILNDPNKLSLLLHNADFIKFLKSTYPTIGPLLDNVPDPSDTDKFNKFKQESLPKFEAIVGADQAHLPALMDAVKKALEQPAAPPVDYTKLWGAAKSATTDEERKKARQAIIDADAHFLKSVRDVYGEDFQKDAREKENAYLELLNTANPDATKLEDARKAAADARTKLLADIEAKNKTDQTLAEKFKTRMGQPDTAPPAANPVLKDIGAALQAAREATNVQAKVGDWSATPGPDGAVFKNDKFGDYTVKLGDDGKAHYFGKDGKEVDLTKLPPGLQESFNVANKTGNLKTAGENLKDVASHLSLQADHFAKGKVDLVDADQKAIQQQLQQYADAVQKAIKAGVDPATIKANLAIIGAASKYGGTDELNTDLAHKRGDNTMAFAQQEWAKLVAAHPELKGTLTLSRGQDVIGTNSQAGLGGAVDPAKVTDAATYNNQAAPKLDPKAVPKIVDVPLDDKTGLSADTTKALDTLLATRSPSAAKLRLVVTDVDAAHEKADVDAIKKTLGDKADKIDVVAAEKTGAKGAKLSVPAGP